MCRGDLGGARGQGVVARGAGLVFRRLVVAYWTERELGCDRGDTSRARARVCVWCIVSVWFVPSDAGLGPGRDQSAEASAREELWNA